VTFTTGTDAYGKGVGRYSSALAEALCDAAGVSDADAALDVGCGPGALVAELARRLGTDRVAGIDPSPPFVAAAQLRVPGADIREALAERLPFADASFDVVLSQLVVNFMSDPHRALAEMRRVGRRTVAACVWDYAGAMTMLRVFWDSALELDPQAPDEGAVMRFCTPPELAELWTQARLRGVVTGELVVHGDYVDFDDYWSPFPAGIAPSGAYCASLEPDRQEALREACFRRLGSPTGPFRLSARAWFVRGEI
jgi:SAM-dependent methyltransferase